MNNPFGTSTPPGGFEFFQACFNWHMPMPISQTLTSATAALIDIRKKNRFLSVKYGLSILPEHVQQEIIDYNVRRLHVGGAMKVLQQMQTSERQFFVLKRSAAIGDVLAASAVAQWLTKRGQIIRFLTNPYIHPLLQRLEPRLFQLGDDSSQEPIDVDLDGAYDGKPDRRTRSMIDYYWEAAQKQLGKKVHMGRPANWAFRMKLGAEDRLRGREAMDKYPKPWVVISPRSNHANRTVPDEVWSKAAMAIEGTCFWCYNGSPAPVGIVDLGCSTLDDAVCYIGAADLVITTDTGPMHIAAGLRKQMLVIEQAFSPSSRLSDQNDWWSVGAELDCLNCQDLVCVKFSHPFCRDVPPERIANAANERIRGLQFKVSAVVCVHRGRPERMKRLMDALLPQVNEIVVATDSASELPDGCRIEHPSIRYVQSRESNIGYGRKANFGARHTHGEFIWFCNDDCYPEPRTIHALLQVMVAHERIGMVGHLLRYPDGKIQHGGTGRSEKGFGHIDHMKEGAPTIDSICEMENVTGASILVRRQAYYDVDGHSEEYYLSWDDADLCMRFRKNGWRIMYTPFALSIHEEHQTLGLERHPLNAYFGSGEAIFMREWGWYFEKNKGVPNLGSF